MISACYINAAGAFFAFPSAKPRALSIMDGAKDDPLFDVRYDDSGSVDLHMIRAGKINDFVANPDKLNFADLNDIFGPYEKRQRDILRYPQFAFLSNYDLRSSLTSFFVHLYLFLY